MDAKIILVIVLIYLHSGYAFQCYNTLGTSKKWNDNGNEVECRIEAGYTRRKCVKFNTGRYF